MLLTGLKDGTIKIYDVRTNQEIFKITDYKGDLSQISFSNKGLQFAVSWKSSDVCRVFNMKKLGKEVSEMKLPGNVHSVHFDHYGSYLLTGSGSSLSVFNSRKLGDSPIYYNDMAHDIGFVNIARFAPNGKMIVSGGTEDRFMKVFGI